LRQGAFRGQPTISTSVAVRKHLYPIARCAEAEASDPLNEITSGDRPNRLHIAAQHDDTRGGALFGGSSLDARPSSLARVEYAGRRSIHGGDFQFLIRAYPTAAGRSPSLQPGPSKLRLMASARRHRRKGVVACFLAVPANTERSIHSDRGRQWLNGRSDQ